MLQSAHLHFTNSILGREHKLKSCITAIAIATLLIATSSTHAASYQKTDGSIVDPILDTSGAVHPYSEDNLEPLAFLLGADLSDADLSDADLFNADLFFANLSGANLSGADLRRVDLFNTDLIAADLIGARLDLARLEQADLIGADLSGAELTDADLTDANLSNANLSNAFLDGVFGSAFYDANTDFTGTGFDPVAAGWRLLNAPNPIPSPTAAIAGLVGLAGLGMRRRRK